MEKTASYETLHGEGLICDGQPAPREEVVGGHGHHQEERRHGVRVKEWRLAGTGAPGWGGVTWSGKGYQLWAEFRGAVAVVSQQC